MTAQHFIILFLSILMMKVYNAQHAIPLVYKNEKGNFELNINEVENILLDPEIKDLKVAIISVTGKYRRGKSFLLNFFLRYLNSKTDGKNLDNWMESENDNLEGFTWKVQSRRVTTGILIWSKIFVTELNNEKIAIILMDTQGTFDDDHTVAEHTKIFGMVTLMSSFEIYNVVHGIEEDELQTLSDFLKYVEKFHNPTNVKMGQKLQFLVRDWSYPHEFPYGSEGGKQKLEKKLQTKNRKPEFVRVRETLKSSFEDISCYLMPSPGAEIISNPNSNGKLSAMDKTFVQYLREYVPFVLSDKNLPLKEFNGKTITVAHFYHLLRYYKKILDETDDFEPINTFALHTRAAFEIGRKTAADLYNYCYKAAAGLFHKLEMAESDENQEIYESNLKNKINNLYQSLKNRVDSLLFKKTQTKETNKLKNLIVDKRMKYFLTTISTLGGAFIGGLPGAAAGGAVAAYLIDLLKKNNDDE